jgi:hypothetical protein
MAVDLRTADSKLHRDHRKWPLRLIVNAIFYVVRSGWHGE